MLASKIRVVVKPPRAPKSGRPAAGSLGNGGITPRQKRAMRVSTTATLLAAASAASSSVAPPVSKLLWTQHEDTSVYTSSGLSRHIGRFSPRPSPRPCLLAGSDASASCGNIQLINIPHTFLLNRQNPHLCCGNLVKSAVHD